MEKVTNAYVKYVPSENIEKQGKREEVNPYLKKGYLIKEDRNGYWVLVKPAQVLVTLTNSNGSGTFNVKEDMLIHYDRQKISMPLIEKFKKDIADGKIVFEMDNDCSTYSMK